jgi:hypothetical protein
VKPRDVFDLWWLCEKETPPLTLSSLLTRLAIYPAVSGLLQDTAQAWLTNAASRLKDLQAPHAAQEVTHDLQRWLPSAWPMNEQAAAAMLTPAIAQLQAGMQLMREVLAQQSTT